MQRFFDGGHARGMLTLQRQGSGRAAAETAEGNEANAATLNSTAERYLDSMMMMMEICCRSMCLVSS